MLNPLVSVIIPAYNPHPSELLRAVKSAYFQSYSPFEIIVIDDASTKGPSMGDVGTIGKVTILRNAKNLGTSASRNKAIAYSKGTYIALLDQDDEWERDKIQKQIAALKGPGVASNFIFSDAWCAYRGDRFYRYFEKFPPIKPFEDRRLHFKKLLKENFIPCCTALFSRALFDEVGGFNESFLYAEEHDLFLRMSQKTGLTYVNEPLATYNLKTKRMESFHLGYNEERIRILKTYAPGDYRIELIKRHAILAAAYLLKKQ